MTSAVRWGDLGSPSHECGGCTPGPKAPSRGRESSDAALRPRGKHHSPDRNPLGCRSARHADAHQSPSGVAKNDQAVEQLERDRSPHEKIKRGNAISVIAQECFPTPGRVAPGAWSGTSPRLIRRPRSRASAARHVSAALPRAGYRYSSVESGHESRDLLTASRISTANAKTSESPDDAIGRPASANRVKGREKSHIKHAKKLKLLADGGESQNLSLSHRSWSPRCVQD